MDEFASRKYPVRENMAFQRRTWIVQRAGWLLLGLILLAALLGLFGGGVLSKRTTGNESLTVEYERFARLTRLVQFGFHFAPARNAERRLHLNRSFQKKFEITSTQPPPLRSAAHANGLELVFATASSSSSQVVIWAHARDYGNVRIDARADDEPPVSFNIFVYP